MSCPSRGELVAFLEGALPSRREAELRAHARGCDGCAAALVEIEPAWLFAGVEPPRLDEAEWAPILAALRREVEAHPRGGKHGWWQAAAALAAAALLALVLLPPAVPPPASDRLAGALSGPGAAPARGFAYLSNPDAEVAQVVVPAGEGSAPVLVTMVVDANLADAF